MITLTIPGTPFAKQRPRFSRKSGRAFTPAETVSFERTVGTIANAQFPVPLECPVKVTINATFEPPASWPKKKLAALIWRPHTQRPDLDNIGKAICDGLNRIAWADDCQIAELSIRKVWGNPAQTVVHIEPIEAQNAL